MFAMETLDFFSYEMSYDIDIFTDTAAILTLPPGHLIVVIKMYLFFCCDHAAEQSQVKKTLKVHFGRLGSQACIGLSWIMFADSLCF